jgi:hypothetical protein
MLIALILIAWLLVVLVCVAACQAAQHGDAGPTGARERIPTARDAALDVLPKLTPAHVTSHGARARGARCAAGS